MNQAVFESSAESRESCASSDNQESGLRLLSKIILVSSLAALLILAGETLRLFQFLYRIGPVWAWSFLALLISFVFLYLLLPLIRVLTLPAYPPPARDPESEISVLRERVRRLQPPGSHFDQESEFRIRESYQELMKEKERSVDAIRRRYVRQLFYSSSIAQNGLLDALLILGSAFNACREIFAVYHGRVNLRELWHILRNIYYSMAIGGSEVTEYAVEDILSKLAFDGLQSVPFVDKIVSSLADGLVNAAMLIRVTIITENYCRISRINSPRDLAPSLREISRQLTRLTGDMVGDLRRQLMNSAGDKAKNGLRYLLSPFSRLKSGDVDA